MFDALLAWRLLCLSVAFLLLACHCCRLDSSLDRRSRFL